MFSFVHPALNLLQLLKCSNSIPTWKRIFFVDLCQILTNENICLSALKTRLDSMILPRSTRLTCLQSTSNLILVFIKFNIGCLALHDLWIGLPIKCRTTTGTPRLLNRNHKTLLTLNFLHLVVICPKEQIRGQPIWISVAIHPHGNPLLFPVELYKDYCRLIANKPCIIDHPTMPNTKLNVLVCSFKD